MFGRVIATRFHAAYPIEHYLQRHRAVIDFLVHPNYLMYARQFLSRLESATECGRLSVFAGGDETERIDVLQERGYQPVGDRRAFLKHRGSSYDRMEYEKSR